MLGIVAAVVCSAALTLLAAPPAADAGGLPPVKLFFVAGDGEHGRELWRSDGTRAGTRMVRDIRPGSKNSGIRSLMQLGKWLLFTANDGQHGHEPWRSDGTAAGTRMVKNLRGAKGHAFMALGPRVGRYVYYDGWNRYGRELWRTDGTPKGTRMVRDIRPGAEGSMENTRGMAAMNGVVYFGADDGKHDRELWRSDGTRNGTYMVKDINRSNNGWASNLWEGGDPEVADNTLTT